MVIGADGRRKAEVAARARCNAVAVFHEQYWYLPTFGMARQGFNALSMQSLLHPLAAA